MKRIITVGFIIIFGLLWYVTDRDTKALHPVDPPKVSPPIKIKVEVKSIAVKTLIYPEIPGP